MQRTLLLSIWFHDGRYHGLPDWPPSPARVFQALVSGVARSNEVADSDKAALMWLESLPGAPSIAAPMAQRGQSIKNFVPNNDLDAVGNDPSRVSKIRAGKVIRPMIFDSSTPLLYSWRFEASDEAEVHAGRICRIADHLYQLGRGTDMAWASGEILSQDDGPASAPARSVHMYRPCLAAGGLELACPGPGSLGSLIKRHHEQKVRLTETREPRRPTTADPSPFRVTGVTLTHPTRPSFRRVSYHCPPQRFLFELRRVDGRFFAWPQTRVVELAITVRDTAAAKLYNAYARGNRVDLAEKVDPVFVGRNATEADKAERIRIIPLPSIGSPHVTRAIRRILVEVPPNCPLPPSEVEWAFSGLEPVDPITGEISELWRLTPAEDQAILSSYGDASASPATVWRSVTPLALPESARRRRLDPRRRLDEPKLGTEREREEQAATTAVAVALRHAGMTVAATVRTVRREPFHAREARAEAFAAGPRFDKERLWHTEITFLEPVSGPLVIGDGRYQGLGLMAPVETSEGVLAFRIKSGLAGDGSSLMLTRALRRAVLARVQSMIHGKMPLYFTGHTEDGTTARSGSHEHLSFIHDPAAQRLLIIAPHILERRSSKTQEVAHWTVLERAMAGFSILRAGKAGVLSLASEFPEKAIDPLFASARVWRSLTPFEVTRHVQLSNASAAVAADVQSECRRLCLSKAKVETIWVRGQRGSGLSGSIRLFLEHPVPGPIIIGRNRHFGGGVLVADEPNRGTASARHRTDPTPEA